MHINNLETSSILLAIASIHLACTLLNYVGFGASTFKMGKAERQHSWGLQKVLQELHGYMQPNNVSANYCPISYNMAIIITLQPELNPKSMLLK